MTTASQFLMNPNQVHFSRIKASDLLLIDANDPETLSGPDAPDPTAWGLHGAIHRNVPHARCVMHVHSIHATVLASLADSTAAADRPELGDVLQPPCRRRPLWRAGLRGGGRALLPAAGRPEGTRSWSWAITACWSSATRSPTRSTACSISSAPPKPTSRRCGPAGRCACCPTRSPRRRRARLDDYPGQAERHLAELKAILDEQEPAYRN